VATAIASRTSGSSPRRLFASQAFSWVS